MRKLAYSTVAAGFAAIGPAHAAEGGGGMPQLNFGDYPPQVVWLVITFVVLYFIMSKVAMPAISGTLEKRQATIKESLERAEQTRVEAERLLGEYKQQLTEARSEAHSITEQGRKVGESMKEEIVAKAREEAAAMIAKAKDEISAEKRKALDEVTERVADLTIAAASRVVGKALDEEEHKRLKIGRAHV